jgi:hypothetical protein
MEWRLSGWAVHLGVLDSSNEGGTRLMDAESGHFHEAGVRKQGYVEPTCVRAILVGNVVATVAQGTKRYSELL